ncbi:hypothetical protein OC698_02115 ['Gossypium sp.' phytoplasma]|uniref:Uncharacterized protein n=1 Tax=Candidatus Phytoplasma gossypii TaxID=2982629 RepID=A0ABT9D1C2_9MOLU|nr:hypothetical protein ['Gossypium sp.' phytoplasma]
MISTTVSPETKFSRTLDKIQYRSSNGYSLKRELKQGINKFYNTLKNRYKQRSRHTRR